MNPYHKANQNRWQKAARKWGEMHDRRGTWKLAPAQNEYHPFRRIWAETPDALSVRHSYFTRGPHYYEVAEGLFDDEAGDIPSYEFNWTLADYLNAVMKTGAELLAFEEFGDEPEGLETAPTRGLPNHFLLVARKVV